jgi:L-phenylalanine/L-methionine N-acetyltransferase
MHRLAQAHDLPFIYELYMHPQVNQHLLYEQMTIDEFRPIYEDLLKDEIKYIFEDNTTAVGMFKLVPLKHRCDHIVYLGGLAIHPDFGGKGYGLKMMKAIIELAKSKGIKRIELSAGTNNLRAIDLYKKVGFQEEGILRKYTHLKSEGYFLDEMLMSCILE